MANPVIYFYAVIIGLIVTLLRCLVLQKNVLSRSLQSFTEREIDIN